MPSLGAWGIRYAPATMARGISLPLSALALLVLGCRDTVVSQTPNQGPLILIDSPILPAGETAFVIEVGGALDVTAVVTDTEDAPTDLAVDFRAQRTDAPGEPVAFEVLGPDSSGYVDVLLTGVPSGFWRVTGTVTDTEGASAQADLPLLVQEANQAPDIDLVLPAAGAVLLEGEPVTFTATVYDDRGVDGLEVEWYSSVDGVLNTAPPSSTGLLTFSAPSLTIGTHTVTVRATDPLGAFGEDSVEFSVVPDDLPPTTPELQIIPPSPTTIDDLTCLIHVGSSDPEGAPVAYGYRWYRDGTPTLESTPVLASELTAFGESWTCEVIASDGGLDATPAIATVTIANTAPSASGALLTPDPAFETSVLQCAGVGFSDVDGAVEDYAYTWTLNGAPVAIATDTLDGTAFSRGDAVRCTAAPWDGFDAGPGFDSDEVIIQNSPPGTPSIDVQPQPDAGIMDDLLCSLVADAIDADGDAPTYDVQWLIDGVHASNWDGQWTIFGGTATLGQTWTCQVRAFDGFDVGSWSSAETTILPLPGDFVITEFLAAPSAVSSAAGEWVELYNNSGNVLSLLGFELHDDVGDSHIIDEDLVLPPGARAVIARNIDYATNGGVVAAYEYSDFVLDDLADQIVLSFDGVEIDRFDYDLSAYPFAAGGRALGLDPTLGGPTAALNDDPYHWCFASTPISVPASDRGTPGGGNDQCDCLYTDFDGDGWGGGGTCAVPDCDDGDASIYPSAEDFCENSIDENCDAADAICPCVDTDSDGDGWGNGLACAPSDCDDANPFISPAAVEACDNIDQNCDTVFDNGDPAAMCPPTANVVTSMCAGGGQCAVNTCAGGWYDIDAGFATGCECQDQGGGGWCGDALDLGTYASGSAVAFNGNLPLAGYSDWYLVNFPAGSGRPGGGRPYVYLSANPGPNYRLNITYDCSGNPIYCGAENASSWGLTSWEFLDNQSGGTNQYNSNGIAWPSTIYIQVYRLSSEPTCETYQIVVGRD